MCFIPDEQQLTLHFEIISHLDTTFILKFRDALYINRYTASRNFKNQSVVYKTYYKTQNLGFVCSPLSKRQLFSSTKEFVSEFTSFKCFQKNSVQRQSGVSHRLRFNTKIKKKR